MHSIAFIAFTKRGCELAARLVAGIDVLPGYAGVSSRVYGPERFSVQAYGSLDAWTAEHFAADDALVFVGAAGIAVRAIAAQVKDKFSDPAVVAIDEAGRFAVPLLSGHVGGANELARRLAHLTGGQAVISTATDVNGVFAVDEWAARHGLQVVERDIAKEISARLLEGGEAGYGASSLHGGYVLALAELKRQHGLVEFRKTGENPELGFVVGLDEGWNPFERTLHLVPRAVTVGVGCRKGVDPAVLERAVDRALAQAGISSLAVRSLATIDVKRGEPAIERLASRRGWELRYYPADMLAEVPGEFEESAFVEATVGVGNVCERAALAEGGALLLGKQAGNGITVAIALAQEWREQEGSDPSCSGRLSVVGLGPGGALDLTGRARAALTACDTLVGYPVYVGLVQGEFPGKEVFTTPMRQEVERCRKALELAAAGRRVALVCSGDPGVYGMAGPVLELAREYPHVPVEIVPGVSAADGGAAVLGAPLMHDWCCISLSDALTPWATIEQRLRAAAESGLVIALYNPASHKRPDYLRRACDILLETLAPETVCGLARNIGREGQEACVLTLGELRDLSADMFTTVFVGNSQTREIGGRMVTPRGYRLDADAAQRDGGDSAERSAVPAGHGERGVEGFPAVCDAQVPPEGEILLFGGTTEGRELAEWLGSRGNCQVVACCATEYGGELVSDLPNVQALVGPLDERAKEALFATHAFACIVDATHPFATHVSESIRHLAQVHDVPLMRLVRGDEVPEGSLVVGDMRDAAGYAAACPGKVLLTTGTRDLQVFVDAMPDFHERLFVRVLPVPESVERARTLGIPASNIVAMQGPFSQEMNEAILRELGVSLMVTKASGAVGGLVQKLAAARACGVRAVVVGRPTAERGYSLEEAKRQLEEHYGA